MWSLRAGGNERRLGCSEPLEGRKCVRRPQLPQLSCGCPLPSGSLSLSPSSSSLPRFYLLSTRRMHTHRLKLPALSVGDLFSAESGTCLQVSRGHPDVHFLNANALDLLMQGRMRALGREASGGRVPVLPQIRSDQSLSRV